MDKTIILLSLLGACHFLADYTILVTVSMLKAKSIGSPILPIFRHGLVHAGLMGLAVSLFVKDIETIWLCFVIQLISHTIIDTLKGKCNVWIPSVKNPMNRSHWFLFGLGQYCHFSAILIITYICI